MSTPAKSFDNLRNILGKLDRKIDSARSKRLGLDEPEAIADEVPIIAPPPEPAAVHAEHGDTEGNGTLNGRSPFGRAKPLNRTNPGTWIGGGGVG
jgi:hypothetical protein